jgi:glycosyltransferase involved in cell wall biosynthesis
MREAGTLGGTANGLLFFGGYDPAYPRNAIIRKGWEKCGFTVNECRVDWRLKVHRRYPALLWRYARTNDSSPVVFVPDFRHKDVPLAWLIARCTGRRIVFDPLVSRYETRVLDRGDAARGSAQAWHNRNLDRISMRLSDLVLSDTAAHARFYADEFTRPSDTIRVLPVGYDEDAFREAPLRREAASCVVLFYGTYVPLHGVETIVEAASLVRDPRIQVMLVGDGQTRAAAERRAAELPEGRISFLPAVPSSELQRLIAAADIVLGIFGTTRKAAMVVPNKVYQALAVGRPVVTADSPAVRELFQSGVHLLSVPAGDGRALARAIESLANDRAARESLAMRGGAYVRAEFNSKRIGERLFDILAEKRFL